MKRFSLLAKFSIYSLVVIVTIGIFVGWRTSKSIEQQMVQTDGKSTVKTVSAFLDHHLTKTDFSKAIKGSRYQEFDHFVKEDILGHEIVRVKIWNTEGMIVYSDAKKIIGKKYPLNPQLKAAFEGKVVNKIEHLEGEEHGIEKSKYKKSHEIYVPIRLEDSKKVIGAYEVRSEERRVGKEGRSR